MPHPTHTVTWGSEGAAGGVIEQRKGVGLVHDETESHLRPERPAPHFGLLLRIKLNETALVCRMSNVRTWMEKSDPWTRLLGN